MAQQDTLFGQLGLPTLSRGEMRAQRAKQVNEEFQNTINERAAMVAPNDRGVFQAFAHLGRSLAQKATGQQDGELTESENQKFRIMDKANKFMKEQRNDPEWEKLEPEEKAFRSQEAIARAAADEGDMQMYTQISLDAAQKRLAMKKARADLKLLGVQTEGAEQGLGERAEESRRKAWDFNQKRQGTLGTYTIPQADSGFNFRDDPEVVSGHVRPDGKLVTTDGREFDTYLGVDEFDKLSRTADLRDKLPKGGAKNDRIAALQKHVGTTEQRQAREAHRDIRGQIRLVEDVGDVIQESLDAGHNPESIIGSAGGFMRFSDKLFRTARGTLQGFTLDYVEGGERQPDGTLKGGTEFKGMQSAMKRFGGLITVPEGLGLSAEMSSRYVSSILQMAYLEARLAEPGGGRLSDKDVEMALERLGGKTGNPSTMFEILTNNMGNRVAGFHDMVKQHRGIGTQLGLSPDEAESAIYGSVVTKDIDRSLESLERINEGFGRQMDPVTGQTDPSQAAEPAAMPPVESMTEDELLDLVNNLPDQI